MSTGEEKQPTGVGAALSLAIFLAVVVVPPFLYLHVSSGRLLQISGSDSFGYAWQIRAMGISALRDVGGRPGVAGLGGMLQGLHVLPDLVAPPVLGLAASIAVGLATATIVRISLRLALWQSGLIAAAVATWTGTARMGAGYLANLISLTAFVAAIALTLLPAKRRRPPFAAFACLLATGLLHPVFLIMYLGICAAWAVLSLVRARWSSKTEPEPGSDNARFWLLGAAVVATAVDAFILLVAVHLPITGILDLQVQQLGERLAQVLAHVFTPLAILTIAVGAFVVWRHGRGGPARPVVLLGLGWLALCTVGVALGAVRPSFPGFRVLMIALPLPVLSGLGIAGAITLASRPSRALMKVVASVLTVVIALGALYWMVRPTLRMYAAPPVTDTSQEVQAYVGSLSPRVPVVVVMQPNGIPGILLWKAKLNHLRAFVQRNQITNIVLYMGRPQEALAGRQTLISDPSNPVSATFDRVSNRLWGEFGAQVADPASIVIVPKGFVTANEWASLASYVAPGTSRNLAVLRGPQPPLLEAPPTPGISALKGWAYCIVCVLALGLVGGGYAAGCIRSRAGGPIDAAALAPAMGIVVLTLTGLTVAAMGFDPHGPAGIASAGALAAVGYAGAFGPTVRIRLRRRAG